MPETKSHRMQASSREISSEEFGSNEEQQTESQSEPKIPSEQKNLLTAFVALWQRFPRKLNRIDAEKRFFRMIKTDEQCRELEKAIENYLAQLAADGTEPRYVKHFTTFLGTEKHPSWRSWIEVEKPKTPPNELRYFKTSREAEEWERQQRELKEPHGL